MIKKKKKIVFYQQQENFPSNYDHTKLFVSCLFEQYSAGNLFLLRITVIYVSSTPQKNIKKLHKNANVLLSSLTIILGVTRALKGNHRHTWTLSP